MPKSEEKHICCICHKEFTGWGNNPDPYKPEDGNDSCCDECNMNFVIPARISEIAKGKKS